MFTGAMVALVTPFQEGEIDYQTLDELVSFQLENGIDALVPVGTTGECPTLSHVEHKKVNERVVKMGLRRADKRHKCPVAGALRYCSGQATGLGVKLKLDAGLAELLAGKAVEAERKQREHHHR